MTPKSAVRRVFVAVQVSVTTSEIYARADARMKRLALEQAYSPTVIDDVPAWQDDQDLLSWLQKVCQ
ncbi:MAG: hypothetical protein GXX09_09265 [Syntrophomonadaceae bacterium]|nr:hypothetical protein [Syntrophomonadaceae bacterium]